MRVSEGTGGQTEVIVFEPSAFRVQVQDVDLEGIEFGEIMSTDLGQGGHD